MNQQELEEHAKRIEILQNIEPEKLLTQRVKDLIKAYLDGELSADDLRQFTSLDPDNLPDV